MQDFALLQQFVDNNNSIGLQQFAKDHGTTLSLLEFIQPGVRYAVMNGQVSNARKYVEHMVAELRG
jgi:hypothetical protein